MIETTLQDCLRAVIDNRGVTPHKRGTEWQDYGVPVLSANNVKTTGLQKLDEIRYIPEEIYPAWMKIPLEKGDIILTSEAPAGEVFYWDSDKKVALGQRLYGLKVKAEINSKYLKYYLQSSVGQKAIQGQNSGSTVFGIAAATFPHIVVNLPEREDQDNISELLYSIDSKISNNNAICSNLEAMAKLLYDYWFVQFDFPDENGKPYKSSGGKMVWNAELKREIPAGWNVNRLGDLISYNRGISYTGKDMCDSGTPIISLASIDRSGRYIPDGIKYYNQDYPSSKVLKPYDLVMANTDMTQERAVMGKIIFVPDIFEGDILATHHITSISVADELKSYLMMTTQTDWFHNYIKGFSSGTNVLGMDMIGFEDYILLFPSKKVLVAFDKIIHGIFGKIFAVYKENSELASLRDFLLPMLMNGQVKISPQKKEA